MSPVQQQPSDDHQLFLTELAHRSHQSVILNDDQSLWHVVQLLFHEPWFVVTVFHFDPISGDGESGCKQTVLVPNVTDLKKLKADISSPLAKIEDVYVVLPSYMNRSGGWTMKRLSKVWSAEVAHELGPSAQIYETIDGATHCDPKFRALLDDVRNETPFLSF